MSATAVTSPPEHDCPHCAEARAVAEQLRALLVEGHAVLARLKNREDEHRPTDALDESER